MINETKIVVVGAGNVGWHLSRALSGVEANVLQVYSRLEGRAKRLGDEINVDYITDLTEVNPDADLYILSVRDAAIEIVAEKIRKRLDAYFDKKIEPLVVHTSGATPTTVLQPFFKNYGVFYPLQTFSIDRPITFNTLPICVDAKRHSDVDLLFKLAQTLTPKVYRISNEERQILHVAAVIVNNFTNHLYTIANDILQQENIDFEILKPLIHETVNKIKQHPPATMQTGPAKRNDETTIQRHLNYLEKHPDYRKIYELITESITDDGRRTADDGR